MNANLERTTVRDISYLINSSCLKAPGDTPLETLAEMICASSRYKVYLENSEGLLAGVVQAKQIAKKVLELSRTKDEAEDMLPAIVFALNAQTGAEIAEPAVAVTSDAKLKAVLELMDQNHTREIAVVDEGGRMVGTLEAKNILSHYLQAKAESNL